MVHGTVAPGFESVRETLERCFADQGEAGASFVAIVHRQPVADLLGGGGFTRDSLVPVYSVTSHQRLLRAGARRSVASPGSTRR